MLESFNSAVINIVPQNVYIWTVVTPGFLSGHPFNITAMNATLDSRAGTLVWGLDTSTPQRMVHGPMGTPGDTSPYLTYFASGVARIQHEIVNEDKSYKKFSPFDCLQRYTQFDGNASDVILVSTEDMVDNSTTLLQAENSLLAMEDQINRWVAIDSKPGYWECGTSNSFSCSSTQSWAGNQSLVADWNVWGYKIEYCLSKIQSLEKYCSLRLEVPIMIGTSAVPRFMIIKWPSSG